MQIKKKKAPNSTPTPTSSTFLPPPETKSEEDGTPVIPAHDHDQYHGTLDAVRKITKSEGLTGLYAGMTGSLLGVASTNFAYFYWYTTVRALYLSYQTPGASHPSTPIELGLGAVAGALAQLFTIPVAVVTTRQQTVHKHDRKGLIATGREIVDGEDGWTGLWRGLKASLVLVVNPAITYGSYQRLREILFNDKKQLRPWEAFSKLDRIQFSFERLLTRNSPRRSVKDAGNDYYATSNCRQSRPPVEASTSSRGQAFQELPGSHGLHHRARGCSESFQGHRSSNPEGFPCSGTADDDKGEVYYRFSVDRLR